jgi:hypothetical protein
MRYLVFFLCFTVFSQTKIDLPKQATGSPISPNGYFHTVTWPDGKVQLYPGPYFGATINGNFWIAPPNSKTACAVKKEIGIERPVYEYSPIGTQIEKDGYLYVCTGNKVWKRILLEEF